jgi:hypothetical protein
MIAREACGLLISVRCWLTFFVFSRILCLFQPQVLLPGSRGREEKIKWLGVSFKVGRYLPLLETLRERVIYARLNVTIIYVTITL